MISLQKNSLVYETKKEEYSLNESINNMNDIRKSNGTKLVPYFLEGKFPTMQLELNNEKIIFKATDVCLLNDENAKKIDLKKVIEGGRLACMTFKDGVPISICVHPSWYERIVEEKALKIWAKENETTYHTKQTPMGIVKMSEKSYNKMIATFIKV